MPKLIMLSGLPGSGKSVYASKLNEEGKLLLQLRNKAPEKGYWSIPGGKVEMFETFAIKLIAPPE